MEPLTKSEAALSFTIPDLKLDLFQQFFDIANKWQCSTMQINLTDLEGHRKIFASFRSVANTKGCIEALLEAGLIYERLSIINDRLYAIGVL